MMAFIVSSDIVCLGQWSRILDDAILEIDVTASEVHVDESMKLPTPVLSPPGPVCDLLERDCSR